MSDYRYDIGGKVYVQKPLVLGQWQQLLPLLSGITFGANAASLIAGFGEQIGTMLAVVLTEEGQSPRGKDLAVLAEDITFSIDPDTTFKVVEDFFICNRVPSLLEKLNEMVVRAVPAIGSQS